MTEPQAPKRDFLIIISLGFVGVGLAAASWPLAASLAPNNSSPKNFVEVDVSKLRLRTFRMISWGGKPVLVRRWSEAEVWIATQGDCSHCSCLLKPMAELTDLLDEWLLCPCCASRYQFEGKRVSGPAKIDLRTIGSRLVAWNMLRIG